MSKPILTGNEKIVVCQRKGGVGKSTYASQVVAPFLFTHNGGQKVKYIEVDDANKSAKLYDNSEIITGEKIPVSNSLDLSLAMQRSGNVIVDVGGNTTTDKVIKNIGENEDFEDLSWIIPLDASKDGAQNALKTYTLILDAYEDSDFEPKILFVLNGSSKVFEKLNNDDEESLKLEFALFFGSEWMKLDFALVNFLKDEHRNNYVFFDRFEKILMSTALQKLAIEIADPDFRKSMKEERNIKKAELEAKEIELKDKEESTKELEKYFSDWKKASDVFSSSSKIASFVKESIEPQYKKLKELVLN